MQKPCFSAWPCTLAALAAFGAGSAMAHDITNALLTDRAANCAAFAQSSTATATDVQRGRTFNATVSITVTGGKCVIASNAIPNHDFNARGRFATAVSEQDQDFIVTAWPKAAARPTALSTGYDNAVFLNGVKLDQMAAGCFGVGDGRIGCGNMAAPYRFDPLGPGGRHDGTFIDDWEYVAGLGDLDICNGMVQGGIYGYVVTDSYPHVMGCFTGTPDASFRKRRR